MFGVGMFGSACQDIDWSLFGFGGLGTSKCITCAMAIHLPWKLK